MTQVDMKYQKTAQDLLSENDQIKGLFVENQYLKEDLEQLKNLADDQKIKLINLKNENSNLYDDLRFQKDKYNSDIEKERIFRSNI